MTYTSLRRITTDVPSTGSFGYAAEPRSNIRYRHAGLHGDLVTSGIRQPMRPILYLRTSLFLAISSRWSFNCHYDIDSWWRMKSKKWWNQISRHFSMFQYEGCVMKEIFWVPPKCQIYIGTVDSRRRDGEQCTWEEIYPGTLGFALNNH